MNVSNGSHDNNIGIEAAWVGSSITGTIGTSPDTINGFQSFWVGAKKKLKFDNNEGD